MLLWFGDIKTELNWISSLIPKVTAARSGEKIHFEVNKGGLNLNDNSSNRVQNEKLSTTEETLAGAWREAKGSKAFQPKQKRCLGFTIAKNCKPGALRGPFLKYISCFTLKSPFVVAQFLLMVMAKLPLLNVTVPAPTQQCCEVHHRLPSNDKVNFEWLSGHILWPISLMHRCILVYSCPGWGICPVGHREGVV